MTKVLVVGGSARPNSVASKMLPFIAGIVGEQDVEVDAVNVADLNLPFFEGDSAPSDEGYEATQPEAKAWAERVAAADAVVFVMPEYNNSMSAVQKNAIDWLGVEWNKKPIVMTGYGWYGAANVFDHARKILSIVQADVLEQTAGLSFTKEIDTEGNILDEAAARAIVEPVIKALIEKL